MIKDDFVSFEVAQMLKDKGFDGEVFYYYHKWDSHINPSFWGVKTYCKSKEPRMYIPVPTLQMAIKWLRRKHNLCVVSTPAVATDDGEGGCLWNYAITRKLKSLHYAENLYENPETALNNAIKYCLENLI